MLPTEQDELIKTMLWEGGKAVDVARIIGVPVNAVYNVKAGRRGFYVPWPNKEQGAMPVQRAALISRMQKGKGRDTSLQQSYEAVEAAQGLEPAVEEAPVDVNPEVAECMSAIGIDLSEYRKEWALANGYHEEMQIMLAIRAAYLNRIGEGLEVRIEELRDFSCTFHDTVQRLLEES